MKSLILVETTPPGAPITIYERTDPSAKAFKHGAENAGWKQVATRKSPANLTLDVGRYHVVVEKFRGFNRSETDIDVLSGRVHHFKANLSQGAFMAFLRVSSNVRGAYVFVDDPAQRRPPWGLAPHGELVSPGKHLVTVEAPGFEPFISELKLE